MLNFDANGTDSRRNSIAPRFLRALVGVGCIAGAVLMTELALTRIFSVTMYYHFAFLAISIALFGLSASGVFVYVARRAFDTRSTGGLADGALAALRRGDRARARRARAHPGRAELLAREPRSDARHLRAGGAAVLHRRRGHLAGDLAVLEAASTSSTPPTCIGAAAGCLLLMPLLNRFGAPGVVLLAAVLGGAAALLFSPAGALAPYARRRRRLRSAFRAAAQLIGHRAVRRHRHQGTRGRPVLFSKWNSFSRVAVYDRSHGDWSLSPTYTGDAAETRFMDIDSAASTPILRFDGDLSKVAVPALRAHRPGLSPDGSGPCRRFEKGRPLSALVIGPGGGRDLLSALVFGAGRVDGVEINPIIAQRRDARAVPRLLGRDLREPARPRRRRRRPQLRPAVARALRRHPGVARRHLGGDGRRRVHADREHALHDRGVRRLPRPPHRSRHADDHALGLRRPAAGLARAGGVREPRLSTPRSTWPSCSRIASRRSC